MKRKKRIKQLEEQMGHLKSQFAYATEQNKRQLDEIKIKQEQLQAGLETLIEIRNRERNDND